MFDSASASPRTLADRLTDDHTLPRATWGSIGPPPRIVPSKKGRGSYRRRPCRRGDADHRKEL